MRHAIPPTATAAVLGMLALVAGQAALAAGGTGSIRVRILDRDGSPVPEVVVSARSLDADASQPAVTATASMNQHALAFEPHILIVETGTAVEFPNSDDVRHHVYSFSPTQQFNFSVDSGSTHEALRFDLPGIVTLGCNIHDEMLAYIVVVATPHFASTGADGSAELTGLAAGRYELTIWSSRAAAKHQPDPLELDVIDGAVATWEHRFEARLYPPHRHSETSLHWSHY
jgi:plastocyanin